MCCIREQYFSPGGVGRSVFCVAGRAAVGPGHCSVRPCSVVDRGQGVLSPGPVPVTAGSAGGLRPSRTVLMSSQRRAVASVGVRRVCYG